MSAKRIQATITLTDEQLAQLKPVSDAVKDANAKGKMGLALGQLWYLDTDYGKAHFAFYERDTAIAIIKAADVPHDTEAYKYNKELLGDLID